ncbi:MAG: Gfo/Idh/MocA family oxidoreductase [Candidatus Dormibacteraeota bacterium]|nr:Gfo/Idh/MocA family oxidoreductase [Candidatus Dormibacteraeota bacterium]
MTVRIAFVGAGRMAVNHVMALARVPDAELVAMCDVVPEQIQRVPAAVRQSTWASAGVSDLPQPAAYTDLERMLAQERPDAVYVCLPPAVRGEAEMKVIGAGLPVLVEKPLALDLSIARAVLNEIRQREVIAASGYQYRYASWAQKAVDALAGHVVGQATASRFSRLPSLSWYRQQAQSGGQLIETVTHQVDLLRLLAGEVRTVSAFGAIRADRARGPEDDIFDVQSVALLFESGAVGTLACNLLSPTHRWQVDIACEGLDVQLLGDRVRVVDDNGEREWPMDDHEPLLAESTAFVRAVAEGRPDLVRSTYESGVRTLAVTMAADRSERLGVPVDVPALLREELGLE